MLFEYHWKIVIDTYPSNSLKTDNNSFVLFTGALNEYEAMFWRPKMDDTIEKENLYENEDEIEIIKPFDPKQVDIDSKPMVLSNIVDRLKENEIILDPDFQRNPDLWDKKKQSRLIESLLIRIPLPIFYFDMTEDEKLIVVDGVQRLCAIRNFMVLEEGDERYLRLEGLEYLTDLNKKGFKDLPPNLKRRLREQVIQTYIIKAGTPDKVRNSIFERINTGGLVLTPAEIKNSVYRGRAADLLKRMAEIPEFKSATRGSVQSERMLDREFANRFLAFYLLGIEDYQDNLDKYLNEVLIKVKSDETLNDDDIVIKYRQAMNLSEKLLGENAFRKRNNIGKYSRINKPLFEATSVCLAKLSDEDAETILEKKEIFLDYYYKLFDDSEFIKVITNGTASLYSVKYRHDAIRRVIVESLGAG